MKSEEELEEEEVIMKPKGKKKKGKVKAAQRILDSGSQIILI